MKRCTLVCLVVLAACSSHGVRQATQRPSSSPAPRASGSGGRIAELRFIDARDGWALLDECGHADCDAIVFETSDGGASWHRGPTIGDGSRYGHITVTSDRVIFAYGPELSVSRDGAKTWSKEHTTQAETRVVAAIGTSVWRVDSGDLCAFGGAPCGGGLLQSQDSGRTWGRARAQPAGVTGAVQLLRVSSSRAWLVTQKTSGDRSAVIQTTSDGARTWKSLKNPCAGSKYGADVTLSAIDSQNVWLACGTKAGTKPQHTITLRSHDAGMHWAVPYPAPETGGRYWFSVSAPDIAWLSMAASPVGASEDDGMTWGTRLNYEDNARWGPVVFADAHRGWIAYGDEVFRTTDAGHHWRHVRLR